MWSNLKLYSDLTIWIKGEPMTTTMSDGLLTEDGPICNAAACVAGAAYVLGAHSLALSIEVCNYVRLLQGYRECESRPSEAIVDGPAVSKLEKFESVQAQSGSAVVACAILDGSIVLECRTRGVGGMFLGANCRGISYNEVGVPLPALQDCPPFMLFVDLGQPSIRASCGESFQTTRSGICSSIKVDARLGE